MHVLLATTQLYFPSAQIIPKKGIWMEVGGMMGNYLSCSAAVCNDSRGVIRTVLTQWTITPLHTYWRVHQTKKKEASQGVKDFGTLRAGDIGENIWKWPRNHCPWESGKDERSNFQGTILNFFNFAHRRLISLRTPHWGRCFFEVTFSPPKMGTPLPQILLIHLNFFSLLTLSAFGLIPFRYVGILLSI